MKQKMIVTNIRFPQEDYFQVKAIAAELGMSVNEYMWKSIKSSMVQKMMAVKVDGAPDDADAFYDDMLSLANSVPNVKVNDVSDDDAIIYGIYD